MPKMIYTSYQTNSFKRIKSTFSIYELPHAPVIFLINLGIYIQLFWKFRQSRKFSTNYADLRISATDED